jgi:phospholipase C
LLGFRVPTVIASPWTRSPDTDPRVQHIVTDHTSILKLIEWRWGLEPLTARDASSDVQNLALALDFSNPNPIVPNLPTPIPPVPQACPGTGAATTTASSSPATRSSEWGRLLDSGLLAGWPLPAAR